MLSQERYKIIVDYLQLEESVSNKKLTAILQVSIDTVRRDLNHLEKEGKIRKVHGGAVLSNENTTNLEFENRKRLNLQEKKEITEKAILHIKDYQAIALNAGTTNIELAKLLVQSFDYLTIITNSLIIDNILSVKKEFTIIITGGFLNHDEHSFYGKNVIKNLYSFNADIAFINANSISLKKGLTDTRPGELEVINAYMENVEKVIFLADSSKFERTSYLKVCDLEKIDMIITDKNIDWEIFKNYKDNQINVIK